MIDVIYSMVAGQPGNYVVTPEALTTVKKVRVSERVLGAIVAGAGGTMVADYDMLHSGVSQKVKGEWVMIPSEHL